MYTLSLSGSARKDLTRTVCWYEAESSQMGEKFLRAYYFQADTLKRTPFIYATFEDTVRRCAIKPFPYHIYYDAYEEAKMVNIIAIIHQHQDPEVARQRLV